MAFLPVVVKDLEAVDVEHADDSVSLVVDGVPPHLDGLVDLIHDPGEQTVVDRLEEGIDMALFGIRRRTIIKADSSLKSALWVSIP